MRSSYDSRPLRRSSSGEVPSLTGPSRFRQIASIDLAKVSAGLLLYRLRDKKPQVLLVHPGGPFWAKKDAGSWSIPKGEAEPGEDLLAVALREVHEETGFTITGPLAALSPVKQPGKWVHAWAAQWDGDAESIVSNMFRIEYPPRSGRFREFPEVDKAEWFDLPIAREKILQSQRGLLEQFDSLFGVWISQTRK